MTIKLVVKVAICNKPLEISDIPDIGWTSLAAKKEGQGGPSGRLTTHENCDLAHIISLDLKV
jgi:hypothetical protein